MSRRSSRELYSSSFAGPSLSSPSSMLPLPCSTISSRDLRKRIPFSAIVSAKLFSSRGVNSFRRGSKASRYRSRHHLIYEPANDKFNQPFTIGHSPNARKSIVLARLCEPYWISTSSSMRQIIGLPRVLIKNQSRARG